MTEVSQLLPVQPLLNVAEVAEVLGISPASIYKRRSLGEPMPPAVRIGSVLRWRPADVESFIKEHLETSDYDCAA